MLGIPRVVSGIAIAVLTWLVIIGGIKSIGRAAEKLSPLKVGLYLAGGLIVILMNAGRIPDVLAMVVQRGADDAVGFGFGMFMAMRYGIARGIYANEAGYGTAAVAYGTAQSTQPAQQGLNAVMETFIVSFVTSSISALTILLTGAWQSGLTSTAAVAAGFNSAMPVAGGWIVAFCTFLFGYTTLIGWAYYGEQFFEYILGRKVDRAVSLDLLPADSVRRDLARRSRVGVGRSDERAAGVSQSDRRDWAERDRGEDCARQWSLELERERQSWHQPAASPRVDSTASAR